MKKPIRLLIDSPTSWPDELVKVLDEHHELMVAWEISPSTVQATLYDEAVESVGKALTGYCIRGWHCTRLTDQEITHIIDFGMQLPDEQMLVQRINALVSAERLSPEVSGHLIQSNEASAANRTGRIWFCFFPPRGAGERGIGRFFRHWGGEVLYNSHEDNPVTSSILRTIGTPCLVEADVPISSLAPGFRLATHIVRNYLASHGHQTDDAVNFEDRCVEPISAECVRRVVQYPTPDFLTLTGCVDWRHRHEYA